MYIVRVLYTWSLRTVVSTTYTHLISYQGSQSSTATETFSLSLSLSLSASVVPVPLVACLKWFFAIGARNSFERGNPPAARACA